MKLCIIIKYTKLGFKFAVSYKENEKEYPIRNIFNSEQLVEEFYKICLKDSYLYSIFNNESIFGTIKISETEVLNILNNYEMYNKLGFEIRLSDNIKLKNKIEFSFIHSPTSGKMMKKISLDGIELSTNDISKIKNSLYDFILFDGKWRIVDRSLITQLSNNDSLLDILKTIKQSKNCFKNTDISIKKIPDTDAFEGVPASLNCRLKGYQQIALNLLYRALNCHKNMLLADDMGLGKTITIISLLAMFQNENKNQNLIIVPKTLIHNWMNEIEKFAPNLSYYHIDKEIDLSKCVHITTYGHVMNNIETYKQVKWNLIVLDEAQNIKNHKTKVSKSICDLNAVHKIAMTGTPIENSVMDLWSIFKFLDSTLLGDDKEFIKTISTSDMFKMLVDILEPYVIRRVKTDKTLGLNLPSKIETTVYCELTDEQKVLYNATIELFEKNVLASKQLKRRICALSYINLLKRILSDYKAIVCDNDIKYSNCKINAMVGYLREQNKPKTIVFTQYKKTSETIAQELSKLYGSNGLIINGTLSAKKRVEIANKFQTGAYPFIVITLKAGNAGLTLTEANHVIHFDRWWNPSIENQATDRAYRIGQKEDVHVVKLVTRGTLEERIDSVLKDKMMLFDNVINKLNMTNDELLDFIKYKE